MQDLNPRPCPSTDWATLKVIFICTYNKYQWKLIIPPENEVWWVYWFHPVCLSVHLFIPLSICSPSVDMILSLHVLRDGCMDFSLSENVHLEFLLILDDFPPFYMGATIFSSRKYIWGILRDLSRAMPRKAQELAIGGLYALISIWPIYIFKYFINSWLHWQKIQFLAHLSWKFSIYCCCIKGL